MEAMSGLTCYVVAAYSHLSHRLLNAWLVFEKRGVTSVSNVFDHASISDRFDLSERIVLCHADCMELLRQVPDEAIQLVVTSPPYNIGKEYEKKVKPRGVSRAAGGGH